MMKVDYGKAAPPSAQKHTRVDEDGEEMDTVDASQGHCNVKRVQFKQEFSNRDSLKDLNAPKSTNLGLIDADDLETRRINNDLCEVLTRKEAEDVMLHDREQLADESDFKIEYSLEEIEVPVGTNEEELNEEELLQEMG